MLSRAFSGCDALSLVYLAQSYSKVPGTCLLWSGGTLDSAQKSFLWLFPYDRLSVFPGKLIRKQGKNETEEKAILCPWRALKEVFIQESGASWCGYLGYEMGFYSEKKLQEKYCLQNSKLQDAYFQRSCLECVYDHVSKHLVFYLDEVAVNQLEESQKLLCFKFFYQDLDSTVQQIKTDLQHKPSPVFKTEVIQPFEPIKEYSRKVEEIQEFIRSGDVYQLNLSQEACFSSSCKPFDLFLRVLEKNPSPFSAFFTLENCSIISSSPERFLAKSGTRLETRPIKGTRPRGKTAEQDEMRRLELITSEKEIAELLMITDLMRNDLSKVSEPGTVIVDELLRTEVYENVFHRLSIISSCAKELHPLDIIKNIFPGGSVTGCPKIRAMELISQFEKRRRGIYTGSIGYIRGNGDFDWNIAIRTLVMRDAQISLQVGGGIVIDSNAEQEYLETLYKASTILSILGVSKQEVSDVL